MCNPAGSRVLGHGGDYSHIRYNIAPTLACVVMVRNPLLFYIVSIRRLYYTVLVAAAECEAVAKRNRDKIACQHVYV